VSVYKETEVTLVELEEDDEEAFYFALQFKILTACR
jgi:hypothetical protein